jgi:hypothetical protein
MIQRDKETFAYFGCSRFAPFTETHISRAGACGLVQGVSSVEHTSQNANLLVAPLNVCKCHKIRFQASVAFRLIPRQFRQPSINKAHLTLSCP